MKQHKHQDVSQSLKKVNLIASWLINNISIDLDQKQTVSQIDFSIMKLIVNYQFQLLIMTNTPDHLEFIQSQNFLTAHTLTIFLMDSKDLNSRLSDIFNILTQFVGTSDKKELDKLSEKELETYIPQVSDKLILLESLFKFWEKMITLLLGNTQIEDIYWNKVSWIKNLLFSIEWYLQSFESLNQLISFIETNNVVMKIDEELITLSKVIPQFQVVSNLVSLLKSYWSGKQINRKWYSNNHLTTLWSLVFEVLSWIDSEKVKEERILKDMIEILLDSCVELQEITYLVQTSYKISPNSQFICTLLFEVLNKSIGTQHEEVVYTLWDKWLDVLIVKPNTEIKNSDNTNVEVIIKYNNTHEIASIFYDTSSYLIKYLNYGYFGGVVGASEINFKKAKIISELFFINRATNEQGELMLEKAFIESKHNPELRAILEKGFQHIVTWLLISSGEHSGPINTYVKTIENQCKYIIQIASDTKDCSLIQNIVSIYKMLISNIEDLLSQNRIPLALAFSKTKSIHQILESVSEYLLVSEEIVSDFVFAQEGLDYFLKQLLSHGSESKVKGGNDEEEKIDTSSTRDKEGITISKSTLSNELREWDEEELNDELFEYVSEKLKEEQNEGDTHNESKKEDNISITGQQFRTVTNGDFIPNEFARTMTLVDSNIEKAKELTANIDWSVNKKGYRQRLVYKKFEPGLDNEIWMVFKLNRVIEIKEIQIGFTNFWTVDSEVYIEPSSVIVETGLTETETNAIWSLKKIDDKGFANFGTTVYGLNLYAFNKQSQSNNTEELMETNFKSLQSLKARYIKFKMRNNSMTCLENSPLITKYIKPKSLGINFCSIMGYDLNNVGNITTTINSLKRATSSKILSLLFKGQFKHTLNRISNDEYYVQYLKTHLNELLLQIQDKTVSNVVTKILQVFTKYNQGLGDWIIGKLLDINCNNEQVSLLYELIKCNPQQFISRLNMVKNFILIHCKNLEKKSEIIGQDFLQLEPFMTTFISLVNIYYKNLQIEGWWKEVLSEDELIERKELETHKFIGI